MPMLFIGMLLVSLVLPSLVAYMVGVHIHSGARYFIMAVGIVVAFGLYAAVCHHLVPTGWWHHTPLALVHVVYVVGNWLVVHRVIRHSERLAEARWEEAYGSAPHPRARAADA